MGAVWFFLGCACGFGVASLRRTKLLDHEREVCKEAVKMEQEIFKETGIRQDVSKVGRVFADSRQSYLEGFEAGRQQGHTKGYQAGRKDTSKEHKGDYNKGLGVGMQQGSMKGHTKGYKEGYDKGYGDGFQAGRESTSGH
jgi:flagellar biosynthesis/type III secretory pathway protein FliH